GSWAAVDDGREHGRRWAGDPARWGADAAPAAPPGRHAAVCRAGRRERAVGNLQWYAGRGAVERSAPAQCRSKRARLGRYASDPHLNAPILVLVGCRARSGPSHPDRRCPLAARCSRAAAEDSMKRLYTSLIIRAAGLVVLFGLLYVALFPHRASACDTFDV